jgi:hypothetical protein
VVRLEAPGAPVDVQHRVMRSLAFEARSPSAVARTDVLGAEAHLAAGSNQEGPQQNMTPKKLWTLSSGVIRLLAMKAVRLATYELVMVPNAVHTCCGCAIFSVFVLKACKAFSELFQHSPSIPGGCALKKFAALLKQMLFFTQRAKIERIFLPRIKPTSLGRRRRYHCRAAVVDDHADEDAEVDAGLGVGLGEDVAQVRAQPLPVVVLQVLFVESLEAGVVEAGTNQNRRHRLGQALHVGLRARLARQRVDRQPLLEVGHDPSQRVQLRDELWGIFSDLYLYQVGSCCSFHSFQA